MDEIYVVLVHCPNRKDVEKGFDTYDEALKYMGIMGNHRMEGYWNFSVFL